jgi:hypothetical protein
MTTSVRRPLAPVRGQAPRSTPSSVLAALTLGAAIATAAGTIWWPGVLTGPPAMNGSARGTALVVLLVAVPLVAATAFPPRRRSVGASAICAGGLAYLTYNGVLFAFATPFNRLFLLYVALLGLSGWTLAVRLRLLVGRADPPARRSRAVALFVGAVAGANVLLWLSAIVPAVLGERPGVATEGMGVATNPVWVQDLSFWLPAAFVIALGLWRRRSWSRLLGLALLVFWVVEGVSIAVDQVLGVRADPTSSVVLTQLVSGFLVLAAITLVPLGALLRTPPPDADPDSDSDSDSDSGP